MSSEFARISDIAKQFGPLNPRATGGPHVRIGIGDDAAVLEAPREGELVWTIDEQVQDTHFSFAWLTPYDVGYRATVAATSDIAAMGATPWCALAALSLSSDFSDDALRELTRGQADAARRMGLCIVGGNLARGPCVAITTTVLGTASRSVTRSGAKPGDLVLVAGPLGEAAAGLRALQLEMNALGEVIDRWRRPTAQVEAGRELSLHDVHAAIDVSDGLAQDLSHVALASGVRVVIEVDRLSACCSDALRLASKALDMDPLQLMLTGGEDYSLVVTCARLIEGYTCIGRVESGEGLFIDENNRVTPLAPKGYDHFKLWR